MTLLIGAALQNGHYVLDSVTHQDDSGAIYRGTHVTSGQVVSVKLLKDNLPQYLDSFLLRAELIDQIQRLAQLRHPNIVDHLFCFEENGLIFIAMEADVGLSLAQIVGSKRVRLLTEATALRYLYQIADAVSAVRQVGLHHLDLDPRLIFRKPGTNRIVLTGLGFSLVSLADSKPLQSILNASDQDSFQSTSQPTLKTNQSDIYQLAVLLYYLLTGQLITPGRRRDLALWPSHRHPAISKATQQAIQLGLGLPHQTPISTLKEWLSLLPDVADVGSADLLEEPVFKPGKQSEKPVAIAVAPVRSKTPPRLSIPVAASDQRQIRLSPPATPPAKAPSSVKQRPKIRNLALITTIFVSTLMGLGFGTALRFGVSSQSSGIRFDPDQSFPPLDNWLEDQPAVDFDTPYLPSEKSLADQPRSRRSDVASPNSEPSAPQTIAPPVKQEREFNWLDEEAIIPDYPTPKPRSGLSLRPTYPEAVNPSPQAQNFPKPPLPVAEPFPSATPTLSTLMETLPSTENPTDLEASSGADDSVRPIPASAPIVAPTPVLETLETADFPRQD